MERGDVYMADIPLPNRQGRTQLQPRRKLAVVLQGGVLFEAVTDVAVVISSSDHRGTGGARPFEVLLDRQDGVDHDTIVDCRWPFTLPKRVLERGEFKITLSPQRMHEISRALVAGLEIR